MGAPSPRRGHCRKRGTPVAAAAVVRSSDRRQSAHDPFGRRLTGRVLALATQAFPAAFSRASRLARFSHGAPEHRANTERFGDREVATLAAVWCVPRPAFVMVLASAGRRRTSPACVARLYASPPQRGRGGTKERDGAGGARWAGPTAQARVIPGHGHRAESGAREAIRRRPWQAAGGLPSKTIATGAAHRARRQRPVREPRRLW
jgi:hypothetical protein